MPKPKASHTQPPSPAHPPPGPPAPDVISATPGVFGATITVRSSADGLLRKYKKSELISALQKAVRRQCYPLAAQAVGNLMALAAMMNSQMQRAMLTNMVRRICIIAKEDCAESPIGFARAFALWKKHVAASVSEREVLSVVQYLCSHGTSRLPSHMRAYHESQHGDLLAELQKVSTHRTSLR